LAARNGSTAVFAPAGLSGRSVSWPRPVKPRKLLHLPDKPAGGEDEVPTRLLAFQTCAPVGQAGRGRREAPMRLCSLSNLRSCRTSRQGADAARPRRVPCGEPSKEIAMIARHREIGKPCATSERRLHTPAVRLTSVRPRCNLVASSSTQTWVAESARNFTRRRAMAGVRDSLKGFNSRSRRRFAISEPS